MSAVSVSQSGVRPILADAVDVARRALLELEPTGVGPHIGVTGEDEAAATHRFEATLAGYRGWQWAVVVAAPPDAQYATVSESALLPGPDALVAPDFVPWEQRIRPGDLAPGDLLAPPADDPRLVPGYVASGDPAVDEVALEIGLGRTKVLSREGREEAAERWYSEYGPETDMAKAAPSTCGRCGFYLPLAGALRSAFGVCGNAMGANGHVVHAEYGCGAHSDVEVPTGGGSPLYEAFDDAAFDVIPVEALRKPAPEAAPDPVTTEGESSTAAGISDAAIAAEPTTVEPSDRGASDTAAQPREAGVGDVATSSVESAAISSDDVTAEPNASVAHDVSVPGADGQADAEATEDLTGEAAEPTSVEPGGATSSDVVAESPSAVEPNALPSDDVAAEPNAAVDFSAGGVDGEPSTEAAEGLTSHVVESTVEPGVGASSDVAAASPNAVESSAVESSAVAASDDVAAEPNTAAAYDATTPSGVSEPGDAAVDLTADSLTEPDPAVVEDAAAPSVGTEADDATAATRTAAIAEPPSPEPGAAASRFGSQSPSAVESNAAHLPGEAAAESSTSGEPNVVAQGVADMSSAAAAFGPAADVVTEPSAVVEPVGSSDADRESIGAVAPGADAAEGPVGSTTGASVSRETEPNSATAESVAGSEATATAGSASFPTSGDPSAETAASQWESSAELAPGATAGGGEAAPEAVASGAAGDTAAVESSTGVAASQPESGAEIASGAIAGSGVAVPLEAVAGADAAIESSAEVSVPQPGSGVGAAAGAVVVEPGAEGAVPQPESDAGFATGATEVGDAAGASAIGAEGGVAAGESSVDEAVSEGSGGALASDVNHMAEPVVDATAEAEAAVIEPGIEGAVPQPESGAGAAGAAADFVGGAEVPDDEASSVRGEVAEAHGVSADADRGAVDADALGADNEVASAVSASVNVDGGVAHADGEIVGADGASVDSVGGDAGVDGGVAHARSETTGVDDEDADVGSASADIGGGVAHAGSETAGAEREDAGADSATADSDGGATGTDGEASAVRGEAVDADGAVADADGGHPDADGGVAGAGDQAADGAGGSGPGAAARPEFGSSLQG
ncbi:DUF3027 domain-containing protein [Nocardia sp. CA-135953]|uniref:DUF3027 domain-containing protein n=1 Tax=Nocardia sp. CA-135953 TaxID=3239978 RepID=UPI003D971A1B